MDYLPAELGTRPYGDTAGGSRSTSDRRKPSGCTSYVMAMSFWPICFLRQKP